MIEMKNLPYEMNALEPYISERTLSFHYGKHYAGYVKNTNDLIRGTEWESADLIDILTDVAGNPEQQALFNNAAQVWNHEFFWNSLTAEEENKIVPEPLMRQILKDFGSMDVLLETLKKTAVGQFGSGWAWLVFDRDHLRVISTPNAVTPVVTDSLVPLLCIDVWEHAYYLDYQNRRPDFVQAMLDHCLNWQFAARNFV